MYVSFSLLPRRTLTLIFQSCTDPSLGGCQAWQVGFRAAFSTLLVFFSTTIPPTNLPLRAWYHPHRCCCWLLSLFLPLTPVSTDDGIFIEPNARTIRASVHIIPPLLMPFPACLLPDCLADAASPLPPSTLRLVLPITPIMMRSRTP
jgi:hypothetical protein